MTLGRRRRLLGKVELAAQDELRLMADLGAKGEAIAEVGLDPGSGAWFYKALRPDKDRPNALATVMSTLVELAENVGPEELECRLLGAQARGQARGQERGRGGAGDTWEADRAAQAKALLQATRERCRGAAT